MVYILTVKEKNLKGLVRNQWHIRNQHGQINQKK